MKIAVYGATGNAGSRLVSEAVARGHEVLALSRSEAAVPAGVTWQHGDLADTESVRAVAAGVDAVVTANGPSRVPGEDPSAFVGVVRGVAEAVSGTRLLVIGGAGSLLTPDGVRLVDSPGFPDAYRTEALAAADALEALRASGPGVDWTYVSPAPEIAPGERTGSYRTSGDTPAGSFISFEDLAAAIVDEIEQPAYRRARFTAASR